MKHKIILLFTLLFLYLSNMATHAQQGVVSAGGEATGSGGSMSFSTGQTDFMYFSSKNGSIQFGLQQGFFFEVEISSDYADLPYAIEVYGMRGEVIIRNDQLTGWQQHLSLQGQQPGLYLIRVQRGEEMGVERIIKR